MGLGIASFSRFITELNDRTRKEDAEALAHWAAETLSQTIGFDAAWYGWAKLNPGGVEVFANATLNLPDDFCAYWRTMSDQDLLSRYMIENPGKVAIYDRSQLRQTDGMASLSDKFGLRRMTTAMHGHYSDHASFYISSYRMGAQARNWTDTERDYLQCAVDQLSAAMRLTSTEPGRSQRPGTVTIMACESGIGLLGLSALRETFGDLWPRWTDDHLPEQLARLIGRPGQHILADHDLAVSVETSPSFQGNGMGLRRLTLRRLTRIDRLSPREAEVAHALSNGHSHKEVARLLGLAPSTVRNQTQAIYQKLGVDNRASLSAMLTQAH